MRVVNYRSGINRDSFIVIDLNGSDATLVAQGSVHDGFGQHFPEELKQCRRVGVEYLHAPGALDKPEGDRWASAPNPIWVEVVALLIDGVQYAVTNPIATARLKSYSYD